MERVSSRRARGARALVPGRRALLGLALLALVACGSPRVAPPRPGPPGGSRGSATPAATVAFPQLAPVAGERTMLAALLEGGTLTLVDGCLRVTSTGESNLIIWPPEVALRTDGGDVRVVDAARRVVARVGEEVRLSGGQLQAVGPGLREAPPARCPGPYWLTGRVLAPEPLATPRGTATRPPAITAPLDGTRWALASLDGAGLLRGTTITLRFTGNRLAGSGGCNDYGAEYTAPGGGTLTIPEVGSTVKLCWSPEGVMEQERRYLDLLGAVTAYRRDGERLRLETDDGRALLFAARD